MALTKHHWVLVGLAVAVVALSIYWLNNRSKPTPPATGGSGAPSGLTAVAPGG